MIELLSAAFPGIFALAASASAQSKDALVGTWKLVSATVTTEKGEKSDAFGRGAIGFLTYTADGRMMAMISHGGRKPLSVPDYIFAPASERAEAFATFAAYGGRYTYNKETVIHHVEVSSVQNHVGTDIARMIVKLQADELILRTPQFPEGGRMVTAEVIWQRLKGEAATK
jgi:hypothetical protein